MKLLKKSYNKMILFILIITFFITKINCTEEPKLTPTKKTQQKIEQKNQKTDQKNTNEKTDEKKTELEIAQIEAKLDLELSHEDSDKLKNNVAYREVLKSMLIATSESDSEDEKLDKSPKKKIIIKKTDKKVLNSQMNKLLTFMNKESKKDLEFLENNEYHGKTGLGWVFKDWKDYVDNHVVEKGEKDDVVFKHLTSVFTTLKDFPKVINYHLEDLNKIDEDNNGDKKDIWNSKENRSVKNYLEQKRDYQIVIDETDDAKKGLKLFLDSLPEYLTDEDIKELSHNYINLLKNYVEKEENKLKTSLIPKFSKDLKKVKKFLNKSESMTLEETEALMYLLKVKVDKKLGYVIASDKGNEEVKNSLKDINLEIWRFQRELEKRINLKKPLKKDFDNLMSVLKQKILNTENVIDLKHNVRQNLRARLRTQLEKEFAAVDEKNVNKLITEFSKNTLNIIDNKLKKSLSQSNIQKVVYNLARAAENDLENLKDSSKKSNFIWDINNINKIANKASEEIKMLHEKNGKIRFRINMKEFDDFVKKATKVIDDDYKPENWEQKYSSNKYINTSDKNVKKEIKGSKILAEELVKSEQYLEKFEDDMYNVLVSKETSNAVEQYSKKYLKQIRGFYENNKENIDKSNFVNTFFEYIHENEKNDNEPKEALRLLLKSEVNNNRKLSLTDKKSLKYLRHLLLRWINNYKHNLNYSEIFEKENKHLLDIVYHKALYLGPDIDEVLGKNKKRRILHNFHFDDKINFKNIGIHFLKKNNDRVLKKESEELVNNFNRFLKNLGGNEHLGEISKLLDITNSHLDNAKRNLNEIISDLK